MRPNLEKIVLMLKMLGLCTIIVTLLILIKPAKACELITNYQIKFGAHPCIKPYKKYDYLTCHAIPVTINEKQISIPQDFQTDLASIPRWMWPVVAPAHSKLMQASILHDYLYTEPNGFNRKEIDSIFYDVLVKNGVDKTHAYLMYNAVRLFGGSHFNYADTLGHHLIKHYGKSKISK